MHSISASRFLNREVLFAIGFAVLVWAVPNATTTIFAQERSTAQATTPCNDRAEERRAWFENWYRTLGFKIVVPKPTVSTQEFERRDKRGQSLFFRPPTSDVSYGAFMAAVGQGDHWTVKDKAEGANIKWEPTKGYWFWVEVEEKCPRLNQSWKHGAVSLLSLEEYTIVWYSLREEIGRKIDGDTRSWLRTRYQVGKDLGALRADGIGGGAVCIHTMDPEQISAPFAFTGGRLSETVK